MKMMILAAALLAAGAVVLAADSMVPPAAGQRARGAAADGAEQMYNRAMGEKQWKNDYTGEDFAWQTNASGLHEFLSAYERSGDQTYLDYGVKFYDAVLAKMATGPDGYKGFIGPYEYTAEGQKPKFWCDDHVGDAILFDGILAFSLQVARDPKLKEKYGDKAMEYVNSAKKNFFEKWDSRGTYHEDGPFGFYVTWNKYLLPGDFSQWKPHPEDPDCASQDNLSVPFNKDIDCGALATRIWLITGEETYKHRAEQLYGYMKSRMQNYNGAYHWNYWEPTGQWDLGKTPEDVKAGEWNPAAAAKTMRHWTAVHPERNYQTGEISNIVLAYNAGIVFTEADIKGMIQTNLKVMWNGDRQRPQFANSNADLLGIMGKPESYAGKHAGSLWPSLGQFDADIRGIGGRRGGGGGGNGGAAGVAEPSFKRRYVKGDVEIPKVYAQFPLGNVRTVQMACVLPSIFPLGKASAVDCKLIAAGNLEVALYSADGKSKIAVLKSGKVEGGSDGRAGVSYFFFNGTLPDGTTASPGDYRIRWTVAGDGYREFPITIQPKM